MYCFDLILKFERLIRHFAYRIGQSNLNPNLQSHQTQFNLSFEDKKKQIKSLNCQLKKIDFFIIII